MFTRIWDWSLDLPPFIGGALFLAACWVVIATPVVIVLALVA